MAFCYSPPWFVAMKKPSTEFVFSGPGILILLALAKILLHTLTSGQYGFHRDELATLDDARYLAWGYVAYPPVTPCIARLALELFGPSLVGARLFSAVAMSCTMVLSGLMARELGASRSAQTVAAVAVATAPLTLFQSAILQYVCFDYTCWVLVAYLTIRLRESENPHWWLGIGVAIGLGMMTKYTMAFCVAGILVGVILTDTRRYLSSPWLWGGVALSLLIFLPNLIWQIEHNFISLDFLRSIHERDVRMGRTRGFLIEQFIGCVNPLTIQFVVLGLYFYFVLPQGKNYRLLGWMYVVPLVLFLVAQSRSYYLAPAYPMLIAAGAVVWERWLVSLSETWARLMRGMTWLALVTGGLAFGLLLLPVAPVNSPLWNVTRRMHDGFTEQIGWPELVGIVATIYTQLPPEDKPRTSILAGNYGEAGAINLYGPAYHLPTAISGTNSYWLRGYGDPPQVVIALGFARDYLESSFESCYLAGHPTNRYGVENEETKEHPDIFVCRELREPWPLFWKRFRHFG
jgi:4-amino-4-deoxy-L-arabinose transferase-like glycosyltransferase